MSQATILFAASTSDADLLYLSGFTAPDPFVFFRMPDGRKVIFASDLEYDRARKDSRADEVVRFMEIQKALVAEEAKRTDTLACAANWLEQQGVDTLEVPGSFPIGAGEWLRGKGFTLKVLTSPLAPQRRHKRADEVDEIRRVQRINEKATQRGIDLIAAATVDNQGALMLDGEPLTSERVRMAIQVALVEQECFSEGTIVAGGEQGCDPHNHGTGALTAGSFIIIDVFPKSLTTNYFADMTRTVLKGKATPDQRAHYEAVRDGQEQGIAAIRAGAKVRDIHLGIHKLFKERGFETGLIDGRMQGFFHGTGHGVGLQIHEAPRFSDCDGELEEADVVTVEPGLYYAGKGGVRVEDLVVVTADGCENLTRMDKAFEVE